jgi:hypothetical protein
MLLFDIQAHPREFGDDIAASALTIIREEAKRYCVIAEVANESVGTGD